MLIKRLKDRAFRLLPSNAFARGVAVLVGGTAGAQFLLVLASPLLTRLYNPDDFGVLAVYVGLLSVLAVVASMRYELAIPLPEHDQDAVSVVVLSMLIVFCMTIVSAVIVLFAGELIAEALGVPELGDYFWVLPVGVMLQGWYKVVNSWAVRNKEFTNIARTRFQQAVFTLAVQLLFFKGGAASLLMGQASGQGVGGLSLTANALRREEFRRWKWSQVWLAAYRYRKFPLFSTWSGFFNALGQQLPPLLLAALFSGGAAGLYMLAHRVLAMPISIVGEAVGKVFFANASSAHRDGCLGKLTLDVHEALIHIALPPSLIFMFLSPDLFSIAFGEQWVKAGELARWMTPWLFMVFISSPLMTLFEVLEHQKSGMVFQGVLLFVRISSISIGAWQDDFLLAILLFSLSSATCLGGFVIWVVLSADVDFKKFIFTAVNASCISIFIALPVSFSKVCGHSDLLVVTCAGVSIMMIIYRYMMIYRKVYL